MAKISKTEKIKNKVKGMSYHEYISSPFWQRIRKRTLKQSNKCQVCGSTKGLNVHHKLYSDFGVEDPKNLIVLCRLHHKNFHDSTPIKKNLIKETDDYVLNMKKFQIFNKHLFETDKGQKCPCIECETSTHLNALKEEIRYEENRDTKLLIQRLLSSGIC